MSLSLTIVVTGGAGFVGRWLVGRLLSDGHRVIVLDNLSTSHLSNIGEFEGHPMFSFRRHDVTEPILDLVPERVDQIYNLACPAAPGHYQFDPIKTIKTAFLGVLHCLDLARRDSATVLQASTSEVYGDPDHSPQSEDYRGNVSCIGPRACYDEGKRVGETLMFDHERMHGTRIRVVRIFNTYGPYMHPFDGRVVSNLVIQALQGKDITIYGDGSQTRSFQFITDLVEALVRMMNNPSGFKGPVNLGNPREFTILQLAQLVTEKVGSKSKIVHRPLPEDDPKQRRPDITVAKRELGGWEPKVPLEEGLDSTIAYFRGLDLSLFPPPTSNHDIPNPITRKGK
jgi:UDP-glucuronate decarboxylase